MKTTLLAVFLLVSFRNAFADSAGQFKLSDKECKEIAKDLSEGAFEHKVVNPVKDQVILSAETVKYLDTMRMTLSARYAKLCGSKKDLVTFDDLYKEQSSCREVCKDNLKVLKKPALKMIEDINGTEQKSLLACNTICEESADKLDAMKKGLSMGLKSKVSPDCNGAVSDTGRNATKDLSWKIDSGMDAATKAKKASEK